MKKIMLLIALFAFVQTTFAQKAKSSKVPESVKMAFAKAYPHVEDVDWEKEDSNYEAEFDTAGDQEMSVVFDANGGLLETEVDIVFSELPKPVQTALQGKKVKETAKITNAKGVVTYEVEVRRKDLLFDALGNPVK